MPGSVHSVHHRFRTWLTPSQQRGVRLLARASVVSVVGVSVTGLWQFFAHRSNPGWYDDEVGSGASAPSAPSEGLAELYGVFAFAVAAVALVGGAWFAYKVPYDIPWPAAIALAVAVGGLVTGSVIRFNLFELRDREFREAGRGNVQVFGTDLEFVVTDRFELGPLAIRLWTVGHVLTLPIMVAVIWSGLSRAGDAES